MEIKCINAGGASPPGGHYSHVCLHGGLAYISGQLPIARDGLILQNEPFEAQVRQVLRNLEACLLQVGASREKLLQVRVYITDMANWPHFDALYSEWIGSHRPARAVAGISELHYGLQVELEAVAVSGKER